MASLVTVRPRLPATVIALGLTSFFTDLGAEMIVPLLPLWLAGLGAGPAFLGAIEGGADALAATLKLISGTLADRTKRDKPWVVGGYALATLVRPLAALSTSPWHILSIRLCDRVGKGLRTAPRDAMLARSVDEADVARAFGWQRALDHAGALAGPLVASSLLAWGWSIPHVFWLAAIPGALAVVSAALAPEPPRAAAKTIVVEPETARLVSRSGLRRFVVVCGCFALGNSSDVFLLVRASELGLSNTTLPIVWALLNASKMAAALLAGRLIKPQHRPHWIAAGWSIYAATYCGFATVDSPLVFWILIGFYGLFHGITEPAERAFVKHLAPNQALGQAYGWYNAVSGWLALPAALLTGWLWQRGGAMLAFGWCACMALLSAMLVWRLFIASGNRTTPSVCV